MTAIQNETKVQALLKANKSVESIVDYLVMNDDYRTKPEARTALTAYIEANNLVPAKKVPMSEQYKAWFKALSASDKKAQTKDTLHLQAVAIGMSDKSADWYARVYLLANELAQEMAPADEAPTYDELSRPLQNSPWKTEAQVKADLKAEPAYGAWYKALSTKAKKAWMAAETGSYLGDYTEECFADSDGNSTYITK